jgi:hypothetical protein
MRGLAALTILGLTSSALSVVLLAQDAPTRSASIQGEVRGQNGQVVRRARICSFGEAPRTLQCVLADTAGAYRIDSLYPGPHVLRAECETGRFTFHVRGLDSARIITAARRVLPLNFTGDTEGCDQRPYEVVTSELTGHWAFGFELNDFTPCTETTKHAWVDNDGSQVGMPSKLPRGEPFQTGQRWFVRWRGLWLGPRSLLPPYRMTVDEVFEIRLPRPTDCALTQ